MIRQIPFIALMKLEQRAPNNGTFGVLNSVLRHPPQIPPTPTIQLPECQNVQILKCGKCDKTNDIEKNFDNGFFASKQYENAQILVPERLQNLVALCFVKFHNSTLIYSKNFRATYFVEEMLTNPISQSVGTSFDDIFCFTTVEFMF